MLKRSIIALSLLLSAYVSRATGTETGCNSPSEGNVKYLLEKQGTLVHYRTGPGKWHTHCDPSSGLCYTWDSETGIYHIAGKDWKAVEIGLDPSLENMPDDFEVEPYGWTDNGEN